jgi:D-alanine-D-alanine ligase
MLPRRTVVLVNTDFESRRHELESSGPRAYEADAAVLDTARAVGAALAELGVETDELHVSASLRGVVAELQRRGVDTVFNLVESIANDYGREWQVPALLDRHGIRYTGNGAVPLRLCRTKDRARKVLARAGARVARGLAVRDAGELGDRLAGFPFPAFVKPARVDGSIGIDRSSICADAAAVRARVAELAAALEGPFLVEEYLPGKEINVSIFPSPRADGLVVATEIDFSPVPGDAPPIVTYDGKWNPESPEYLSKSVPAQLSPELWSEVEAMARRAFLALGGEGYGRVDMRLDARGAPCIIDVNPNNDIHPEAGLATAARSVGWTYPQLIGRVLETAHAMGRSRGAESHRRA